MKKISFLTIIVIISVVFMGGVALGAELSGRITLYGEPLADILVKVEGGGITREVSTGADGLYSLSGLSPGEYSITPIWDEKVSWWQRLTKNEAKVYSFLPNSIRVTIGEGDVEVKEFRTVPYSMPVPKMKPEEGKALPLGGGEGYTLTPSPSEATKVVEPGDARSLVDTIRKGRKGDLIYVPPGDYLLVNDKGIPMNIVVPDGVTVFGSRDETIIRTVDVDDIPPNYEMWIMGDNTRLTGLSILGPDTEPGPLTGYIQLEDGRTIASAYYKPIAVGILVKQRTELDNISVRGFPHAAILVDGKGAEGFVHHSYIADNVRTGLGYGVKPCYGGTVEVAYCKFYRNRHSMDATGGSYYVHDCHFDSENPMGIGVIFQHPHEENGLIVIQDNTVVNAIRGIHMFAGYGVISGNTVDASNWALALRRGDDPSYKGHLHDFEIFDNNFINGDYYFSKIKPEDNVYLDNVNVGELLEKMAGSNGTITLKKELWDRIKEVELAGIEVVE